MPIVHNKSKAPPQADKDTVKFAGGPWDGASEDSTSNAGSIQPFHLYQILEASDSRVIAGSGGAWHENGAYYVTKVKGHDLLATWYPEGTTPEERTD